MSRQLQTFDDAVSQFVLLEPQYPAEAYYFVRDGFSYTVNRHAEKVAEIRDKGIEVSALCGSELAEGLRDFALDEYGPMARFTLAQWNITTTVDFGNVVYNLIKMGQFAQNKGDRQSDFDNVFDLGAALVSPFDP